MYSEIWMPLAAVSMAFALPPLGRPGFGSNVSIWLGAPGSQMRITVLHFLVFGAVLVSLGSCFGSAFVSCPSAGIPASAPMPSMLNDRKSRRPYAGTMHFSHAIANPSKLSIETGSMSGKELRRVHQGPVRVLHALALVTVDVLHEALGFRRRRLPRHDGQEHIDHF